MKTVGLFEAKNNLSKIVADVEHGEAVLITRNGRPVAQLVPLQKNSDALDATVAWILEHRMPLKGITTKQLIDEGRHR